MKLYRTLASGFLASHPEDAARILDTLPEEDILAVLGTVPASVSSGAVRRMAPNLAAIVVAQLGRERAAEIVQALGVDSGVILLRRMESEARDKLVDSLEPELARSLRSLLRYPEDTAGALMDPGVLALPGDLSVRAALGHLRAHPESVRYNLYVIDREQRLAGVLNLRELLLARPKDLLREIAHPKVHSIQARAGRSEVLAHPAWNHARSVPVIDGKRVYLGAVRYQTLRRLENELREGGPAHSATTVEALGDLFSAGIGGVVVALGTSAARTSNHGKPHGA